MNIAVAHPCKFNKKYWSSSLEESLDKYSRRIVTRPSKRVQRWPRRWKRTQSNSFTCPKVICSSRPFVIKMAAIWIHSSKKSFSTSISISNNIKWTNLEIIPEMNRSPTSKEIEIQTKIWKRQGQQALHASVTTMEAPFQLPRAPTSHWLVHPNNHLGK